MLAPFSFWMNTSIFGCADLCIMGLELVRVAAAEFVCWCARRRQRRHRVAFDTCPIAYMKRAGFVSVPTHIQAAGVPSASGVSPCVTM